MKALRFPQWLWISGWLAAAVVSWAISFAKLSELLYRPLPPAGVPTNQLRMKLKFLEQRLAERGDRVGTGGYRNAVAFFAPPAKDLSPRRPKSGVNHDSESPESPAAVSLPRLSGILRTATRHGQEEFSALFEGKVHSPGDRLQGFVLEKISAEGVVLSREGRRRFIPAPEVYFSIQRSP